MRDKGFTLIELMVTVTILGIIAAMAFPSFSSLVRTYQVSSLASDYRTAIQFARNQAISSGSEVVIKPEASSDWASGITVSIHYSDGTSEDLRYVKGSSSVEVKEVLEDVDELIFNGRGFLPAEYNFTFCNSQVPKKGKLVHLLKTGISAVKTEEC